jgi:hypothetical protein
VALLREGVQRAEQRELEACAEADEIREALKRVERQMVLLGASPMALTAIREVGR